MSISRRTVIAGATGATVLTIAACTSTPSPAPTATVSPTPSRARPTAIARSHWSREPFSQGSTSYLPVGGTAAHRARLAHPIAERLFFAGEATSVEAPNQLEGARDTGVRAAEQIVRAASAGERIAVIGAGMAGAACARALSAADLDVIVIEARDRVGGRVLSLDAAEWGLAVELGGMRAAAEGSSSLRDDLAEAGVPVRALDSTARRAADGAQIQHDGARERVLDRARAAAENFGYDVPLSTALTALAPLGDDSEAGALSEEEAAAAAVAEIVGGRAGALARQLSAANGIDELAPRWDAAVGGSLQQYVADLIDGIDVLRSSAVTALIYDDEGVAIRLGTGESISVDRVVITIPLGVLKDGGVAFDPPLPAAHREAIASLGVGELETVALRFEAATWSETAAIWHGDPTAEAIVSEWINLQSVAGAPVLVGLIGPQRVAILEQLTDDELIDQVMDELAPFFRSA
ncbi:MAG: FAD-dependent oxidoreductase [Microcella sp.]|uniref:flavin monoamine oxidase family protein n=1 Tax=Microcella sp. TaxID=1913979 RepID=UPI0024C988CE|nr:FAD-dependent oxidoreductase [Microcella sp.]UYN84309.1 MAG: FAD-dependent oxidoreductase [Microcella sp.]